MKNFDLKNVDCHAALAMTKSVQSGRSMIEMLGVLAIIGVLSVGGIAGYSKAMMKYRINKTIEQITLIAGNVRAFFGSQKNYAELDNCWLNNIVSTKCQFMKKAKLIPDEMWREDGIETLFSKVAIGVANSHASGDHRGFYLRFYPLPTEACIDLLSYDWRVSGITVIRGISKSYEVPIDLDSVIQLCETSEKSTFYFDLMADVDVSFRRTMSSFGN